MKHLMEQLQEAAKQNGPLCVGLDTDPSYIPESVLKVTSLSQLSHSPFSSTSDLS